ncbi:hypothetical protein HWD03_gp083 [Alteromonas phage vB_AmeM_PT11-V22]|uniref:Uncharacterized protein n=1 Tax=Alteromonas phage vB_AmeM_PT11-V22 TaxID=2704031 RepID=A0A6C0R2M6_9CAUD|nr:hypothetical protein HWD03_gp083 [Alteromonas phage vB_AmeM_PT11-V22]QHZ59764.1 hypothetical protein [Alteromonas phage vB_AmeM_PT11-V22]
MKTIKTTASVSMGRNSNNEFYIHVEDEHSGNKIVSLSMDEKDFAFLITGLHGVKTDCILHNVTNVGKKRVIERVSMPEPDAFDKGSVKMAVREHFEREYEAEGWKLWDDGTSSQQNSRGLHNFIVVKYVPVEDDVVVEKYY